MNSTLVVIFCYNVEENIANLCKKIKKVRLNNNSDLLFIDDNSIDHTNKIIKSFNLKNSKIFKNKKNKGYGLNYKFSIKYSIKNKYEKLIFLHGDDQYPANKVSVIDKKLNNYDLCYGSRRLDLDSMVKNMPKLRSITNFFLTGLINFLLKSNHTEYFSGLRGFKINKLKKINLKNLANNWIIEQQIHFEFIKKKYKIAEFPIPSSYKKSQVSRLPPLRYVFSVLTNVIKYSFSKNF